MEGELDALRHEVAVHRERAIALERDRQAVVEDRDVWRERATRTLWTRVRRTLRSLVRKPAPDGRRGDGSPEV